MLLKLDALRLAKLCSSDKDVMPAISHLHIAEDGTVAASDGRILLSLNGLVSEPGLFDSEFAVEQREWAQPAMVSAEVVLDFLAACRAKGKDAPSVLLYQKDKAIDLATTDGVTTKRFLATSDADLSKPGVDVAKVLKLSGSGERRTLVFDLKVLLKLLTVLKALGAERVELGIPQASEQGDAKAIKVVAESSCGTVTGAVMPMVKHD